MVMQAVTAEEILKRREKVFRKMRFIKTQPTLDAVLRSFPESERQAVFDDLRPGLSFDGKYEPEPIIESAPTPKRKPEVKKKAAAKKK